MQVSLEYASNLITYHIMWMLFTKIFSPGFQIILLVLFSNLPPSSYSQTEHCFICAARRKNAMLSPNTRVVKAGRDLWRSPCPSPLLKQGHLVLLFILKIFSSMYFISNSLMLWILKRPFGTRNWKSALPNQHHYFLMLKCPFQSENSPTSS